MERLPRSDSWIDLLMDEMQELSVPGNGTGVNQRSGIAGEAVPRAV
ncbi:MAG: hypothetical protein KDA36_02295 [Planctomycetaceae bacterium]|nr:hypothetical protein [Planctomycetaceae bacterium]